MTYAFSVCANFLRAQLSYAVTVGCAVLSAVRPPNLSENPLRQRALQPWFGCEAGTWLANLHNALIQHGVGHLHEAGYVGADDEIARLPVLFRSVPGVFKDSGHDLAQPRIDLLARPW